MIRIKKRFLFLLLFCFLSTVVSAQSIVSKKIDSVLSVLKGSKEDINKINTLNELSREYRTAGDYEKTIQYANSALLLAEKLNYIKGKAWTYNILGAIDRDKGNYPGALKNYFAALKIMEETGYKYGMAVSYLNIGVIYNAQGNYPEALKYHLASLKIKKETGDKRRIAISYGNIGGIYNAQGNYPEALANYLAALKINEELGNKLGMASSYHNIGIVSINLHNYREALKNHLAALKIREELGDKRTIAGSYHHIGVVYEKLGNYPEALKNHLASLKIKEEIGDKRGIANSYYAIGNIYMGQSNYPGALKIHLASLKIREEIGDKEGIAVSNISTGNAISKQTAFENAPESKIKYNEALQYLNKGLLLAKEIGIKESVKDAYNYLAETYKAMNDYQKALEYNNLYVALKDSILNNETTRKLEQLRTQYEVEKAVAAEKVQREKAIDMEKVRYEFTMAEEKAQQEKILAEQKFLSEKTVAEENARHQQELTEEKAKQEEEKAKQEKEKAERKRKNELALVGLVMLGIISFFLVLLNRQRNLKRWAIERADAAHKMAELELQSLRAQLNPHFMFNSLNAIQDLILKEDIRSSHRYLSRFSKLLRMLLDNANQPFITLRKELDFLELYLSLEKLRIPDLQYTIKTEPGIDTETTLIPNMTLQPYIENAIWHGLSHKNSDKKLGVNIHRVNGSVQFDIEDNGVGRKKSEELKSLYRKEHKSKGMELLSKRYNLLSKEYGSTIQTRVTDLTDNGNAAGTLVEIIVPLAFTKKTKEILYDTNHYN